MAVQGLGSQQMVEVQKPDKESSWANQMKNIRKQRLRRQVLQDPKLANKLVAMEASPTYNSKGELIQSVGSVS